uniref:Uncharacterized protein LOC102805069 n=1 Tax=Saccoglossus kowalevskii TaxID=10224 RepID=A0ABM0MUY0_SACKO|nr:PREDICTED: uncharacterized protein LOC102805069 [Saccoglossus kowalevskii]
MPLIDMPFKRVAIDLVGPITPASDRGHLYILTMVDYASRYPEAVPLKNIDTETVAEALIDFYRRLGVPEEVLNIPQVTTNKRVEEDIRRLGTIVRSPVESGWTSLKSPLIDESKRISDDLELLSDPRSNQDWTSLKSLLTDQLMRLSDNLELLLDPRSNMSASPEMLHFDIYRLRSASSFIRRASNH